MRIDMAASQVKFEELLSTEIDHMNKSQVLVMHVPPGMAAECQAESTASSMWRF